MTRIEKSALHAVAKRERPILFSAPMVRAILEGRKTQTRRIVKLDGRTIDSRTDGSLYVSHCTRPKGVTSFEVPCPYGEPGDRLWVREAWQPLWASETAPPSMKSPEGWAISYPATDGVQEWHDVDRMRLTTKCKPSIHMPRWASRITLEVTGVRVERLHAITEDDARAEGVEPYTPPHGCISPDQCVPGPGFDRARLGDQPHRLPFADLWAAINGADSWDANPWVWVVSFRRVEALERAA